MGQKNKKWPEMTKNYVCASTPYLSKHASYDRVFLLHKFKVMTSPDVFFIFSKFWFYGLLEGERGMGGKLGKKRTKNGPNWQNVLTHFVSQELYLIWFWFLVHMCQMIISPANFFIFSKVWFFGFFKVPQ